MGPELYSDRGAGNSGPDQMPGIKPEGDDPSLGQLLRTGLRQSAARPADAIPHLTWSDRNNSASPEESRPKRNRAPPRGDARSLTLLPPDLPQQTGRQDNYMPLL